MSWRETIQDWTETARQSIDQGPDYPLIDSREIDMSGTVVYVWMTWYMPATLEEIRVSFENALAPNPDDIAVRFVAICFLFHLAHYDPPEKEEEVVDFRAECQKHLSELVMLRPVEGCTDRRSIRWEIVNACAIKDWDRAAALYDRLREFVPADEYHAAKGQFLFQSVFLDAEYLADLKEWVPSLDQGDLFVMVARQVRIYFPEESDELPEGEHRYRARSAVTELETATEQTPRFVGLCRGMLGRSCFAIGRFHEAALHYRTILKAGWVTTFPRHVGDRIAMNSELKEAQETMLYKNIALAHERAGEFKEARSAFEELLRHYPSSSRVRIQLARIETRQGRHEVAADWLRQECDMDAVLSKDGACQ